jgi:TonB family protein
MTFSAIALCVWVGFVAQTESMEKQAISIAQQTPASGLDEQLPDRPFAAWFNELVGREAGVVWQLSECGAPAGATGGAPDLPACAEASALLPNGVRLVLAISVGTFKKGVSGQPAFFGAVVESGERLYSVRRLRDLPGMLRSPRRASRALPDIQADPRQVSLCPDTAYLPSPAPDSAPWPPTEEEKPPSPPALDQHRKVSQGLSEGSVIKRRMPAYPLSARSMNAYGKVEVRIVISETGQVIEATAISGHPTLRSAAAEAAREWVYKPTTFNGVPIKVETVLTFTFASGSQ